QNPKYLMRQLPMINIFFLLCLHFVSCSLPFFKGHGIVQSSSGNSLQSFLGKESLVGSDHNIRERKKSGCGGVFQNLIRTVLENILGLFLIYIQSYAGKFSGPDSIDKIVGLYQTASGGIDQDQTVFHL